MRRFLLVTLLSCVVLGSPSQGHERSKPNYVGGGRYTCHEDTAGCAIIKQNNRQLTERDIEKARERKPRNYDDYEREIRQGNSLTPRRGNEGYKSSLGRY